MKYVRPDYYEEFSCIASDCPDTCCAGWQIMVDEDSLERYQQEKSEYREHLYKGIKWRQCSFKQDKTGRCYFLREDNLCDMYCNLGQESLCDTCRMYPRHTEEFENVREISLSISCPVVAELLMNRMEPVSFKTWEDDEEEEFEEFDYFLYSALEDTREDMLKVIQNRQLPLKDRLTWVLSEANRMQELYDEGELAEFIFDQEYPQKRTEEKLDSVEERKNQYEKAYDRFEVLYNLERLREEWQDLLEDAEETLFEEGYEVYADNHKLFRDWWTEEYPELEIHLEQIAVYFLFVYFPGAVYDEEIFGKVAAMVAHVALLYDLLMARYLENGNQLTRKDVVELAYRYSREIEHSDENLDQMEQVWSLKAF